MPDCIEFYIEITTRKLALRMFDDCYTMYQPARTPACMPSLLFGTREKPFIYVGDVGAWALTFVPLLCGRFSVFRFAFYVVSCFIIPSIVIR